MSCILGDPSPPLQFWHWSPWEKVRFALGGREVGEVVGKVVQRWGEGGDSGSDSGGGGDGGAGVCSILTPIQGLPVLNGTTWICISRIPGENHLPAWWKRCGMRCLLDGVSYFLGIIKCWWIIRLCSECFSYLSYQAPFCHPELFLFFLLFLHFFLPPFSSYFIQLNFETFGSLLFSFFIIRLDLCLFFILSHFLISNLHYKTLFGHEAPLTEYLSYSFSCSPTWPVVMPSVFPTLAGSFWTHF